MSKILITGGAGYVGSLLIDRLMKSNRSDHYTIYDKCFFGHKHIQNNEKIRLIKSDIRNIKSFSKALKDIDIVLHLACISNDPSFELNSHLSKTINFDCFEDLVKSAKKNGVKKFIYASTSSVYGVSKKKNVKENHPLIPLTDYNKFKGLCEPILNSYLDRNFHGLIIRPATLCGLSPKMRFDLTVNILSNFAYHKKFINVFGGDQLRPNLHIKDMCRLYELLFKKSFKNICGEIYNCGFQNMKIIDIANKVKNIYEKKYDNEIKINITKSNDKRSYHINSSKIKKDLNFIPKYKIDDAINELFKAFEKKDIKNSFKNKNYFNVKKLIELGIK